MTLILITGVAVLLYILYNRFPPSGTAPVCGLLRWRVFS
jgi:hypothetical protein